jgi:hypothetical protein
MLALLCGYGVSLWFVYVWKRGRGRDTIGRLIGWGHNPGTCLREMQACEMQTCEMQAGEIQACEMQACEMQACEMQACAM